MNSSPYAGRELFKIQIAYYGASSPATFEVGLKGVAKIAEVEVCANILAYQILDFKGKILAEVTNCPIVAYYRDRKNE
jgi:hypothetical protein